MSATRSRGESSEGQSTMPATLADAHEVLWRQRPAKDVDLLAWVEFHRHGATVYSRVSQADSRHRYEALACAGMEIRKAHDIEHRLNPEGDEA